MHCAMSPSYAPSTAHCRKSSSTAVARRTVTAFPRLCPSRNSQVRWASSVRAAGEKRIGIAETFVFQRDARVTLPHAWHGKLHLQWTSLVALANAAVEASSPPAAAPPLITITDAALKNLKRLREEAGNEKLLLRMGVRSGGCSGMCPGSQSHL